MSVRIGIGLAQLPLADAREFMTWVDRCEESALDSLWQTDRLVSRAPFLETLSTMALLAGRTRRIKFGMNAVVVPFRDPLLLAKQCATIDFLSGGRLLPVFGVGADEAPEWRASGRGQPAARGARSNEALALMQRLWTETEVTFHGEHLHYERVSISPAPVQRPLPCWIGGSSLAAIRRTARLGTGWLGGTQSPDEVARVIRGIHSALRESGRQIDPDHYGASLAFRIGTLDPDLEPRVLERLRRVPSHGQSDAEGGDSARSLEARARERVAIGSADQVVERLRAYHAAGASKYVLIPLARDLRDLLDQTQRLLTHVIPEVHAWPSPGPASSTAAAPPNG